MNALLPPIAHSPFGGSFVASPFLCSTSPSTRNSSTGSIGTVKHFKQRRASSSSSYISIFSARENPVRVRDENTPPSRSVSVPTQDVVEVLNNGPASWKFTLDTREESPLEEIDLDADSILDSREVGKEVEELAQNEINQETGLGIATNEELGEKDAHEEQRPTTEESQAAGVTDTISQPFRRWMSTLRHKNLTKRKSLTVRTERWSLDDCDAFDHSQPQRVGGRSRHQKTSSHSSSAFITAVKTASASLASLSVAPRSRHAARSNRLRGEHRNSGLSQTDGRPSMDNSRKLSGPFMDEAAWDRAFRRRQILEELVSSEESYVSDLKVLTNVTNQHDLWRPRSRRLTLAPRFTSTYLRQCRVCPSIHNYPSRETSLRYCVSMRISYASSKMLFAIPRSIRSTEVDDLLPSSEGVSDGTAWTCRGAMLDQTLQATGGSHSIFVRPGTRKERH